MRSFDTQEMLKSPHITIEIALLTVSGLMETRRKHDGRVGNQYFFHALQNASQHTFSYDHSTFHFICFARAGKAVNFEI